ncbi:protein ACCELERATED CELL DEATH 6-like [Hevea brasiliensis]|uniref:protein ACCELERATED CELL DEATH 6-like n=1 Tax=Hevea brasiliensis TaxID=3981 RepID=UPI0025FB9FEE|nr:protein ACCELERATED CELL DEATH 6-like [Hevea brasiliensis]
MDKGKRLLGVTDERLWISFQYAAHKGKTQVVRKLLDNDKYSAYNANKDWKRIALQSSHCSLSRIPIRILVLISYEKGWTPLHYAEHKGYTPVVRMLLDRDKDKSSAYIADNDWKRTALHIAACRGFQDIVKEIISKCPGCSELTDKRGWNVLHYAVISKSGKVIKEVLKHSSLLCLLNKKDVEGNTPVHLYKAYHPSLPAFIGKRDVFLFWRKLHYQITGYSSSKKDEILKLMTELGTGPLGEISNTEGEMRKEKMIHKFEKVKDSHLVAAALIATVTFAAAFTVPGGYISDENDLKKGTPILSKNWTFKAFIVSDTIAMVLSTCSVFIHLMLVILGFGEAYYWLIRCAFGFLFYAMVAMLVVDWRNPSFVGNLQFSVRNLLFFVVCAALGAALGAAFFGDPFDLGDCMLASRFD